MDPWAILNPAFPVQDFVFGPWSEIVALSEIFSLMGHDRVVGLVPEGWVDERGWIILPEGRTGISDDKVAPHFVYAEAGRDGFIPAHELGRTFGLSDEPCSEPIWLWLCEDEYNEDVFPTGPFTGTGYDVPNRHEVAAWPCFMGNEDGNGNAWISNRDFESFVNRMTPGNDPRVLVVTGYATAAGGGGLSAAIGRPEGWPDRSVRGKSPFALVVRDAGGATLGAYGIFTDMTGEDLDHDGIPEPDEVFGDLDGNAIPDSFPIPESFNGKDRVEFSLVIPWPAGGDSVALVGPDGGTIHSLAVYSGPLLIDLVEPVGEVRLQPGDLLPVRWRLPAAAGAAKRAAAPMGVSVGVSYDGGQTFLPPRTPGAWRHAVVLDARTLAEPVTVTLRVYALQNGMSGDATTAGDLDGDGCPDPARPVASDPQYGRRRCRRCTGCLRSLPVAPGPAADRRRPGRRRGCVRCGL